MRTHLPQIKFLSAFLVLLTAATVSAQITPGGLQAYPTYSLGPNLLLNSSFENLDVNGKPLSWSTNGFVSDNANGKTGTKSYRITNANTIAYSQSASQSVSLKKGAYRIGGWIKLQNLDDNVKSNRGVRLDLRTPGSGSCGVYGCSSTIEIKGTATWQYIEAKNVIITKDTIATFILNVLGDPDGTAWFDDVELREEYPAPVDVFMMYPNYRGMLFDDQSQTLKFDITVNPPVGTVLSDYSVKAIITNEATGGTVFQSAFTPATHFIASINGASLKNDSTYLVKFQLIKISNSSLTYQYPVSRISKLAGSNRPNMTMSFDEHDRFLVRDKPTFILGVYDAGMGYASSEANWTNDQFGTQRRLFQLPLNFYLNYWYGSAPISSMGPMMNVLQQHGALYLQTANCFADNYHTNGYFMSDTSDNYVKSFASHPGFAGHYIMDECIPEFAPNTFSGRHTRFRGLDPDGVTLAVSNQPNSLAYWRDAADIVATDPYPMYGAEPASGYPFRDVADWTIATKNTLKSSRPFVTAIQFFQFTTQGRWPTQAELRNMSYMSITEGANGLFYWSLGANALAYVCDGSSAATTADATGWCPQRNDYFNRLKNVMNELKGLDSALVSIDQPALLANNTNSGIHTRVKYVNGKGYLITYNYTNQPATATFTWAQSLAQISVYNESRSINPVGSSFTDSFGPYEAHVYVIPNTTLTSVTEDELQNLVSVYPSPAHSSIAVNINGDDKNKPVEIEIFNMLGDRMIELPGQTIQAPVQVDVSGLANGIYFLRVNDGSTPRQVKFVKE